MSSWLESISKSLEVHHQIFLELCAKILELPLKPESAIQNGDGTPIDEPVMEAINHPVGHITSALINYWFGKELSDGELLQENLRSIFSSICDVGVERHRHGRVLLSAHAISFSCGPIVVRAVSHTPI